MHSTLNILGKYAKGGMNIGCTKGEGIQAAGLSCDDDSVSLDA